MSTATTAQAMMRNDDDARWAIFVDLSECRTAHQSKAQYIPRLSTSSIENTTSAARRKKARLLAISSSAVVRSRLLYFYQVGIVKSIEAVFFAEGDSDG